MSIAHDEDERIFEGYKARLECITHQNKDLEAEELELQKRKSRLIHFYGIQKHETENMHAAYVKFLKNDQELAVEEERMSLTLEQCMELEKQLCRFIEVQNGIIAGKIEWLTRFFDRRRRGKCADTCRHLFDSHGF